MIHIPPADADLDERADAELVGRARGGPMPARHAAFAVLVRRYEGFVRAMLYRLSQNAALADDLAQEAFLTAWSKLETLENAAAFRGWLKQLAYRQFLHDYRRRQLDAKHVDALQPEEGLEADATADLEPLLALCTPLERELMVLCYGFEFTYVEIAQTRDMPVGTIKSHVHRAKAKLKAFLEQDSSAVAGEKING